MADTTEDTRIVLLRMAEKQLRRMQDRHARLFFLNSVEEKELASTLTQIQFALYDNRAKDTQEKDRNIRFSEWLELKRDVERMYQQWARWLTKNAEKELNRRYGGPVPNPCVCAGMGTCYICRDLADFPL